MHYRLVALRIRHALLDDKIDREARRPYQDMLHLRHLKKLRLRLREEISKVEDQFFLTRPTRRQGVKP